MALFKRIGSGLLILVAAAVPALAGPNGGGTIILHDPDLAYTVDAASYCGLGVVPTVCLSADVNLSGATGNNQKVWKVYAAFVPGTTPRLKGMSFGVNYTESDGTTDGIVVGAWGPCIGDLNNGAAEFPGPNWPRPNTGTSIVFQDTQTTLLVECYWFAGYNVSAQTFSLVANPDPGLGGAFGDDSVPSIIDPIQGFGTLGFDTDGTVACPAATGACCDMKQGTCSITTPEECSDATHNFVGGACDPNPCPTTGPCCNVSSGLCQIETPQQCALEGNLFPGLVGQTCDTEPAPCPNVDLGACCHDQICTITIQNDCIYAVPPGVWIKQQPCLPADQNPCLSTWGACCIQEACYVLKQADCPEGSQYTPNAPCIPDETCITPVEHTTWGKIKNSYK